MNIHKADGDAGAACYPREYGYSVIQYGQFDAADEYLAAHLRDPNRYRLPEEGQTLEEQHTLENTPIQFSGNIGMAGIYEQEYDQFWASLIDTTAAAYDNTSQNQRWFVTYRYAVTDDNHYILVTSEFTAFGCAYAGVYETDEPDDALWLLPSLVALGAFALLSAAGGGNSSPILKRRILHQ